MNNYILDKICEFISLVKSELKVKIEIGYEYNEKEDMFNLWHDYVKFDDHNFKKVIGKGIRLCFFENDIFNISISYRNDKAMEVKKIYNTLQHVETQSYNLKLSFENAIDNQNYNIKIDSELENINKNFKINLPQQECIMSKKINTNVEILEVPAA
ncbi:hypothetical protein CPAST_c24310 [Clostridium pasteurianum DSM 525 = ATCC 6013]|uniref:Uncharacterized protein n=1 Tax=Clostridium pasteurianum DSM 525 = ATCC 6013 TaxID=1262449 RepID=A0A0H3J3J7_CLOPA|nr:hypothetical protein [Clostridium pasteurianum]AJA48501.1 hypothetical protein CPAST_c24310 [Clostridium pasteurianum DSM 525 = ATCC 6013]AJA52489.1 hypothetical protein CLPA_c24310 [Clostridium pasteurianum DSM 525 = ATCC 6013]AOZ75741.1 hypothetical protein AQ983_11815 [Clostridium pasteurianum DSM 525 = ATCC 6013]AOZ79537.1 hypothetical protein AQ984_11810 [Clostridium pasteurianum]ELP60352.1 hypothetical protein F502_02667 [Clostridium pasteurianum DSM 525 = ATCC 6013]